MRPLRFHSSDALEPATEMKQIEGDAFLRGRFEGESEWYKSETPMLCLPVVADGVSPPLAAGKERGKGRVLKKKRWPKAWAGGKGKRAQTQRKTLFAMMRVAT